MISEYILFAMLIVIALTILTYCIKMVKKHPETYEDASETFE